MEQLELFPEFVTGSAAGAAQEAAGRAAAVAATNPPPDGGDALTGRIGRLIIIDGPPKEYKPDMGYGDSNSPDYIEAERLPAPWYALLAGGILPVDRVFVGTLCDLLEELPPEVAEEWRQMWIRADTIKGDIALHEWEEAHHICWYGEGYYIDEEADEKEAEAATA